MKKRFFILFFLILFVNACAKQQTQKQQIMQNTVPTISAENVPALTPEQVVVLYFQAWNNKQYRIMYSLISDGFKQLEPTAKTFDDFELYMNSFFETASGLNIIESKEAYQTEKEAGVNYKIKIINKDDTASEFESAYTLKKKTNGWKLIHPYGENIDTS